MLAWPGEESEPEVTAYAEPDVVAHGQPDEQQPAEGLWGRSRDFDWGD